MCDKNDDCCSSDTRSTKLATTSQKENLKQARNERNFKQKFQKELCSKCEKKLDIQVGTNGRYCYNHYKLYCTQKMRKAMSKSSGVDMRGDEGESSVIMVKSLESVSSMSLLLLMNQFQDEPKPFKCAIKAIITYSDEATRTSIEKFTKNLKHLSEVPVVLVESDKKCTITSAKKVIEYLKVSGITWALTGSCTSRIAGEILLHATDGAGEHISLDASAFEQPGGSDARFVRPMRDLSRNEQVNVLKTFTYDLPNIDSNTRTTSTNPNSVLSGELQNFLYDLDSEYPAQVFAVYRIGVKLVGSTQQNEHVCATCFRPVEYDYECMADRAAEVASMIDGDGEMRIEDLLDPNFDVNVRKIVDEKRSASVCHSCRSKNEEKTGIRC